MISLKDTPYDYSSFLRPTHSRSILTLGVGAAIIALFLVMKVIFCNDLMMLYVAYPPSCQNQSTCDITFTLEKDYQPPIYFNYQLSQIFQNHRNVISSFSEDQLSGGLSPQGCSINSITNAQMGKKVSMTGKPLDPDAVAIPCGLLAKRLFNDTYRLFYKAEGAKETEIAIDSSEIVRSYERETFRNTPNLDLQWHDMTDPHFQVWVHPSPYDKVHKSYGRVNQMMSKGDYRVQVKNNYDRTEKYEYKRQIQLVQVSWLGVNSRVSYGIWLFSYLVLILGLIIFFEILNRKKNREQNMKKLKQTQRISFVEKTLKPLQRKMDSFKHI